MRKFNSNPIRVACETLGCKVNQAETEALARRLAGNGFMLVAPNEPYDIYILNTCTVTHIADRKSRHLLRMARRRNPDALLVAAGCYAERDATAATEAGEVDIVVGNADKPRLPEILQQALQAELTPTTGIPTNPALRTRAFIKIQDGCTNFCAYCIVPHVRTGESSVAADEVLAEVHRRAGEGCREIVLTGVKVGTYNDNGRGLKYLLERVLNETNIPRLRLSSLQPPEIFRELIELWRSVRLCPHFHLSLQSGCDRTLHAMRRRYTIAEYMDSVNLIRSIVPKAVITTDIIAGFPGETAADFNVSLETCRRIGFARMHVFPFSPRRGTPAASLPGQVDAAGKKARMREMLALAEQSRREYQSKFIGQTLPVLWEQKENALWSGLTGNYIKVYASCDNELTNSILPTKLVELVDDGIQGKLD